MQHAHNLNVVRNVPIKVDVSPYCKPAEADSYFVAAASCIWEIDEHVKLGCNRSD